LRVPSKEVKLHVRQFRSGQEGANGLIPQIAIMRNRATIPDSHAAIRLSFDVFEFQRVERVPSHPDVYVVSQNARKDEPKWIRGRDAMAR
jgi:hypothetical protein